MAEVSKSFVYDNLGNTKSNKSSMIFVKNISSDLISEGLTPLIALKYTTSGTGAMVCTVEYKEVQSGGKFVNFGGLDYNTETGYVVLGYNSNSNCYIPIVNIVEVFNTMFYPSSKRITLDDVNYFVESFKLSHIDFDPIDWFSYLKSKSSTQDTAYESIILSFIKPVVIDVASGKSVTDVADYITDKDSEVYKPLFDCLSNVSINIESLAKVFLGNFITEESRREVDYSIKAGGRTDKIKTESRYLENIYLYKVPPVFMKEISSCGVGMKRRGAAISAYKDRGGDKGKGLAVLSGWAFIDEWVDGKMSYIPDSKISSYNILDLIRAVNKDQDLFFGYDALGIDKPEKYDSILKKLSLDVEIDTLGRDVFLKNMKYFYDSTSGIRDTGATYSQVYSGDKGKVKRTFNFVSVRSLGNAGRVFARVSNRLLDKFK